MTQIVRITIDEVIDLVAKKYGIVDVKIMAIGDYRQWVDNFSEIAGFEGTKKEED